MLKVSTAIVEGAAIRRPCREHLEFGGVVLKIGYLVAFHVVGDDVALQVEDLDFVQVGGMESLMGLVGGVDDEVELWMPCGIDTSREDGVVFHVNLLDFSVVGDDGSTAFLTSVELHSLWVVILVVMAVDALSLFLKTAEHIVVDDAFVVVFQTALINGQFFIGDIRCGRRR